MNDLHPAVPLQQQQQQEYGYVVVVDLEATCDQGARPAVTVENQEIIEFPWVVLDITTGTIVDTQQRFVKPTWSKALTPFCTNLTGITNEQVCGAATLPEVMREFSEYCASHLTAQGHSFCVLTDGTWDFKHMLLGECLRKHIPMDEPLFRTFLDLKHQFQLLLLALPDAAKAQQSAPGPFGYSLRTMMAFFGLQHAGRAHSGVDDCRTIASVCQAMLQRGHVFREPTVIPTDYNPMTDPTFKSFDTQNKYFPFDFQFGATLLEPSCCIAMRGLPWGTTLAQVVKFLAQANGAQAARLEMGPPQDNGKPSGWCYAELATPAQADSVRAALNGKFLGQRYVDIALIPHIPVFPPAAAAELLLRGLPYSATEEDIRKFVAPVEPLYVKMIGLTGGDLPAGAHSSGIAKVGLHTVGEARMLVATKNRQYMGPRYVEVFFV
eukprot:TRINITY_DN645_c1_g1_i1.p1 TRINITY_DN645_c1_g1~~TRINITY_DN645_c1_g1_i1.p1  ORF type:complete len:446 (+),score=108.23 TRINITY_DN645_c1_g1_i1:28-1338(+)